MSSRRTSISFVLLLPKFLSSLLRSWSTTMFLLFFAYSLLAWTRSRSFVFFYSLWELIVSSLPSLKLPSSFFPILILSLLNLSMKRILISCNLLIWYNQVVLFSSIFSSSKSFRQKLPFLLFKLAIFTLTVDNTSPFVSMQQFRNWLGKIYLNSSIINDNIVHF